jgi:hypothetical protein
MSDTRRPQGRLFCGSKLQWMLWLAAPLSWTLWLVAGLAVENANAQNTPATTQISDTVYRADGSAAQGVLLISWGPFTTAAGAPVAAGNLSATLGANGALLVNLVPNAGATPASMYFTNSTTAVWDGILDGADVVSGNARGSAGDTRVGHDSAACVETVCGLSRGDAGER